MRLSPAAEDDAADTARSAARTVPVFALVGLSATLLYFFLANVFVAGGRLSAPVASFAAYAVCAVFSYAGHKYLTFASKRTHAVELPRFMTLTASGALVSFLLPLLLHEQMGLPAWIAFAVIALAIPVINYAVMQVWVFGTVSGAGKALRGQLLFGGALALISALSAINMHLWGTIPDTSYMLTVLDNMRAGQTLYSEIRELNPVFSIWLYTPAYEVALLTGISPEVAVHLFTLAVCLAGAAAAMWIAHAGKLVSAREALGGTLLLYALTVLLSGSSFTERDHLGAAAALPLFALVAWRMSSLQSRPKFHHVAVAAAGAAMLVMVKPYYAIVVVTAAAALAVQRRSIRPFFLPEFVLSAGLFLAYFAAFYAIHPAYFEVMLPVLRETYMPVGQPLPVLMQHALPGLFGLAVLWLLFRQSAGSVTWMLAVCALAAWVPYFLQGKGWAYHTYPAVLLCSVALLVALRRQLIAQSDDRAGRRSLIGATAIVVLALGITHSRFLRPGMPDADFVAAIRSVAEKPSVALVGADIADSHPLTRMVGGTWIEPYCSDWLLFYTWRQKEAPQADPATVARMRAIEDDYIEGKAKRLLADPPDILLVSEAGPLAGEIIRRGGLAGFLKRYKHIATSDNLAAYRRVR